MNLRFSRLCNDFIIFFYHSHVFSYNIVLLSILFSKIIPSISSAYWSTRMAFKKNDPSPNACISKRRNPLKQRKMIVLQREARRYVRSPFVMLIRSVV
ncbi:hypothetical protein M413DRAFT_193945 [Hebeloma cylindrosporum]|uniref:Uncharacterized protein n=1 Tax=Hebeloma cylindrosporum TaxID=76867 RepID=A0A0C3C5X5_HEBCY|nr:hypothetical protein M413DRAFT_193945 [Hebeloma cylindrosporum h7]